MGVRGVYLLAFVLNLILGDGYRGWDLPVDKQNELILAIFNDAKQCSTCTLDTEMVISNCGAAETALTNYLTCVESVNCTIKDSKIETVKAHYQGSCADCLAQSGVCGSDSTCSPLQTAVISCALPGPVYNKDPADSLTLNSCTNKCLEAQNAYVDFTGLPDTLSNLACNCNGNSYCQSTYDKLVENQCQSCNSYWKYQLKALDDDVDGTTCLTRSQTLAEFTPQAMLFCGHRLSEEGLSTYNQLYDKAAICGTCADKLTQQECIGDCLWEGDDGPCAAPEITTTVPPTTTTASEIETTVPPTQPPADTTTPSTTTTQSSEDGVQVAHISILLLILSCLF